MWPDRFARSGVAYNEAKQRLLQRAFLQPAKQRRDRNYLGHCDCTHAELSKPRQARRSCTETGYRLRPTINFVVPEKTIGNYMEQLYIVFHRALPDLFLYTQNAESQGQETNKTPPLSGSEMSEKLGVPFPIAFLPKLHSSRNESGKIVTASLAYLRANAFRIRAEKLPQVFLRSGRRNSAGSLYAHLQPWKRRGSRLPTGRQQIFGLKYSPIRWPFIANFWARPGMLRCRQCACALPSLLPAARPDCPGARIGTTARARRAVRLRQTTEIYLFIIEADAEKVTLADYKLLAL